MNLQEAFNKIYAHAQKKEKAREFGSCRYRTEDGRRCFVGCLIPDDKYDDSIEGSVPQENYKFPHNGICHVNNSLNAIGIPYTLFPYLSQLQAIHDKYDICDWNDELKKFADTHNLTIPSV